MDDIGFNLSESFSRISRQGFVDMPVGTSSSEQVASSFLARSMPQSIGGE
jgi:hypothetical protein